MIKLDCSLCNSNRKESLAELSSEKDSLSAKTDKLNLAISFLSLTKMVCLSNI